MNTHLHFNDISDSESTVSMDSYCSDNDILQDEYDIKYDNIKYIEKNDNMFDINNPILINLFPYQKRSLYKMIYMEQNNIIDNIYFKPEINYIRFLNIPSAPITIKTNIGIYNDELKIKIPLGKYKSNIELEDEQDIDVNKLLTIISLIKFNKTVSNNNIIKKAINGVNISIIVPKKQLSQTLIISEHSECDNILEQFNIHCPELKIYLISTQKHNDNIVIGSWFEDDDDEWSEEGTKIINREYLVEEDIKDYDVIICSHILFYRFYQSVIDYRWNRIVIFDCDKYNLPYKLEIYFNFMWFVLSNPYDLYGENPFVSKIFGNEKDDNKNIMDYLIVKNRMDDIKYEKNL